uniref:Uncharacterized protein n=1 Tax=Tanacetum cinerariifolium TaxID=118510 RepID=A0A699I151_TANCI|nr:hypothetical protein [Tanacetum cinerariifolium]
MAESSSQKTSSLKITPKEEPITLDKPKSPNPLLPASQVDFTFDEITFTTNNEVALLYPSHPNQDYFKVVSDFISKCCLAGDIGITTFRYALRAQYLPHSEHPFTDHIKAMYNLDVPVDSKAPKPSSQTEEDKSPSHPSPPTSMVGEMHKEAQQAASGLTSLGATSKEGAHPQLVVVWSNLSVLVDKINSARDGLKTTHTDSVTNEESRANHILLKVKLGDLLDILKDTIFAFFTLDSQPYEPIIVSDESKEEEEVAKDKDTKATYHDVPKDTSVPPPPSLKLGQVQELMAQVYLLQSHKEELEQAKAKAKVTLMKAKPSYPDIN